VGELPRDIAVEAFTALESRRRPDFLRRRFFATVEEVNA
jgi:hypothetical protein